jgi:hypothetical protein
VSDDLAPLLVIMMLIDAVSECSCELTACVRSGPHRYLFLVFREPEGFAAKKEDVGGEEFVERRSFDAVRWTKRMGLTLVGLNWMLGVGNGWTGEV